MKELHLSRKDFTVEWYSGTGGGGQYRNRHPNCCRITHIETGLQAVGTSQRSREANKKSAFKQLAARILKHYEHPEERNIQREIIRTYHEVRNEVHDKASGLKQPYREVVDKSNIGPMIEARRKSKQI